MSVGERQEQRCTVAAPGAAVHAGEGGRLQRRQPLQHGATVLRVGVVVELAAERLARTQDRSEEHTSELQSLMRISYAVFCLKTKTKPLTPSDHRAYPTPTN